MTRQAKHYLVYFAPFLSLGALLVVLNATSPLKMGPAGILLVFALFYLFLLSFLYVLLISIIAIVGHIASTKQPIRKRKLYYLTSVVALGPVFLLALNSIGQLDLKDFILVALLIVISCFYITRRF